MNHASRDRFPPPLSPAGSSGLPKSTPPAHSWNQVRAVALESPLQVVTRCLIRAVLSFLQQGLEHRLSPYTLKVYIANISAPRPEIGEIGRKHELVIWCIRVARRLNPPRPYSLPSWDLVLVLRALQTAPLSFCSQSSFSL